MQRRIFIGIDLPRQVKKRLSQKMEVWGDLPVKWIKEDNFHITLSFLGYMEDEDLSRLCRDLEEEVSGLESFDLELNKIELGPQKGRDARLVWFSGKASPELKKVQENVEKAIGSFKAAKKEFRPHVTLGRIRKKKWLEMETLPEVEENFKVMIPVEQINIFDSRSEETAGKFITVEACPLK